MHPNAIKLFEKYAAAFFQPDQSILEVGPEAVPSLMQQTITVPGTWETLDISERLGITYHATHGTSYEMLADATYDIVLSGQVIEHVPEIWSWMIELARVCKHGGHVITIAPVSWGYHEQPVDCWRIYPEGMQALYSLAGLETVFCTFESLDGTVTDTIGIARKP